MLRIIHDWVYALLHLFTLFWVLCGLTIGVKAFDHELKVCSHHCLFERELLMFHLVCHSFQQFEGGPHRVGPPKYSISILNHSTPVKAT